MALLPCSSCARHVRESDDACPFCGTRIVSGERVATALPRIDKRFARAAATFLGASALVACGKVQGPPEAQDAATTPTINTSTNNAPAYGPAPMMYDAAPQTPVATDAGAKDAGKK